MQSFCYWPAWGWASEVIALELDDIDWRAGVLTVHGKGRYHDRLPLPHDVGEAIAVYLRQDRPSCTTRRVFIRNKAPHRSFGHPSSISTIVCLALRRAGLQPDLKGAHLLRHSLATGMLRRGASMAEIGQVLRHRAEHDGNLCESRHEGPPVTCTAVAHEGRCIMSALREASQKYLELRRNLGFQLRGPCSALRSFVTFAEREGVSCITTDLALRWAKEPADAQPATWASRLRMVRRFAIWLSATDRRTEVPPAACCTTQILRRLRPPGRTPANRG